MLVLLAYDSGKFLSSTAYSDPKTETYHTLIFIQHLIIFAQTNKKDQGRDIFETVNPLLPFTTLTTDIKEAVSLFPYSEHRLCDTGCLNTRP